MRFGFLDVVDKFFPHQAEGLNPVAFFLFKIGCFGIPSDSNEISIKQLLQNRYNYFSSLDTACKSLIDRIEVAISGFKKETSPRTMNDYTQILGRLNWIPKEPPFKNKNFDAVAVVSSSDNSITAATQSFLGFLKNKNFAITAGNFFIQAPSVSVMFGIEDAEGFLGETLTKPTSDNNKEACQLQRLQKLTEYNEILVVSSDSMIEELAAKLKTLGEDNKTPRFFLFDKRAFIEVAPTTDVLISIIKEKVLDPMIQYGLSKKFLRPKNSDVEKADNEHTAPIISPSNCYAPARSSSLRHTTIPAEISL